MKIRKLQLKNIGVFDNETIEFQPCPVKDKAEIHIFTGQNGSGKSTVLMSLASIFNYLSDDLSKDNWGELFRSSNNLFLSNSFQKRFRYSSNSELQVFFSNGLRGKPTTLSLKNSDGWTKSEFPTGFRGRVSKEIHRYSIYVKDFYSTSPKFEFAVFAFSGYRQIQGERVEAIKEPKDFNPLSQSLEFVKDYNQDDQLTINQLIANNISKSAIEKARNKEKSEKFAKVLSSIEEMIFEITDWKVEFDLETEPTNLISKINGEELDFDVLPDGLLSLISWIADLAGRVDLLKWQDDLPIFEKNLILLLDEIEVHLHPAWQRKVLPVVQKLFKNSQIFVSTHSPFVVNSIDDAWVYELKVENGKAKVAEKSLTKTAYSYQTVLREVFDIDERFGVETQKELEDFLNQSKTIQQSNGQSKIGKKDFLKLAKTLASQSAELQSLVFLELARLSKETGEPYEI